ncbi:hypothetical protein Bbelb_109220 [Branchiostoma belcheri]|nr:hypothetical protein Bbelb_109220 [Branchiostoma belcheri]
MLDIVRAHESVGRQLQEMTGQVNAMSMGRKKDSRGTTHRGPPSFGEKKTFHSSPEVLGPGACKKSKARGKCFACGSVEEGTDPRTDHYVFSMHGRDHKTAGTIDVKIGGVGVSGILIDSGATCNIVSKETWESLKRHRVEVKDQRKGMHSSVWDVPRVLCGMYDPPIQDLDKFRDPQTKRNFLKIMMYLPTITAFRP